MNDTILLFGAGKIGSCLATLLREIGHYEVLIADNSQVALEAFSQRGFSTFSLDTRNRTELEDFLTKGKVVLSALPFFCNQALAQACLRTGCSYFDLTEDIKTCRAIRELAKNAQSNQVFMPQCGLAPGFISIIAHELCQQFEQLESLKMRVGALPLYPSNKMLYNLTWSTEGLINEYHQACEAIIRRQSTEVEALEGLETFSLDGIEYEAFNTSGGLGTLCQTLKNKITTLNYKTIRYPGHCHLMSFLMKDLKLSQNDGPTKLKEILENAIPRTTQDLVLIYVTASGYRNGKLEVTSKVRKIYHQNLWGEEWSSIQLTTASGIATVMDLFLKGQIPGNGFIRQENISYKDFIENPFGQFYRERQEHHHDIH